jgi:alkylation response protein AidB-like acyl-CoA dehydrogenase
VRERKTVGLPPSQRQAFRHKRVRMRCASKRRARWSTIGRVASNTGQLAASQQPVARIAVAKMASMQATKVCADHAAQILGGRGFMRRTTSGRIDYEVKVMIIGGSSEAILKNPAASQLGI